MLSANPVLQVPSLESSGSCWSVIPELQLIHRHFAPLLRLAGFGEDGKDEIAHSNDVKREEDEEKEEMKGRVEGNFRHASGRDGGGIGKETCASQRWKKTSLVRRALVDCAGVDSARHPNLMVTPSVRELLRPAPSLELCSRRAGVLGNLLRETIKVEKRKGEEEEEIMMKKKGGTVPPVDHQLRRGIQQLQLWWKAGKAFNDAYVEMIENEVLSRRAISAEWDAAHQTHCLEFVSLRRCFIRPEKKQAAALLEQEEQAQRVIDLIQPYQNFCVWVSQMIPIWEKGVREKESARAAKHAAIEAARQALEKELLEKESAHVSILTDSGNVGYDSTHQEERRQSANVHGGGNQKVEEFNGIGYPSFIPPCSATPYPSSATNVRAQSSGSSFTDTDLNHQNLRRQAIQMLVKQEEAIKGRRTQQLQRLKDEEVQLRKSLEAKEFARKREARFQQYQWLEAEEALVKSRFDERKRLEEIKREERQILLEHLKAEEEIIRARLRVYEEERQRAAAAAREQEAREKQRHADHLRIEEEILMQRMKAHERQRQMEMMAAAKAKEEREAVERKRAAWRQFEEEERERAIVRARERLIQQQQEEALEKERRRQFFSFF